MDKNIQSWHNSENSSSSNFDYLVDRRNIRNLLSDKTFLVRDSKSYSIYFAIENNISDIKSNWNNNINSCIESYLRSQICIDSYILGDSGESKSTSIITSTNDPNASYLESSNDFDDYLESSNDCDDDSESSNDFDDYLESSNDCDDDSESSNDFDDYLESSNDFDDYLESSNDCDDDSESSNDCDDDSESSDDFDDDLESSNDCDDDSESSNDCDDESEGSDDCDDDSESSNDCDDESESSDDLNPMQTFKHLWVRCKNCDGLNYKKFLKSNLCEHCGYDLKMSSSESSNDFDDDSESSDDLNPVQTFKHLWVRCENEDCEGLNYKKFLKEKMDLCEHCGYHFKMSSSDRIELLIDPGTWNPMDEYMVSVDPIEFHSEEEPYSLDSYQKKTGLMEAVQTGTGQLNGIPLAIGIMEFQFIGGSMGSVVGEKITRLIEYATNQRLPLILVCASGGARMQEGSLSLMQMAKISSALYNYQINQKLFYVPILTSPTTGGVTASFGMLGDIIIAEPNAYIAFAGKRVIEQTLNKEVPEGSQEAEPLFEKGLFDSIVPRNLLKEVLTELFQFHGFVPLTQNEK